MHFNISNSHLNVLKSVQNELKPLTLFLCALTDAYLTVPRNPATVRGYRKKNIIYSAITVKKNMSNTLVASCTVLKYMPKAQMSALML